MGLSLFPLTDRAISEGVFWGICDLSTILGILSADGQSCGPVSLFGMRCLAWKPAGSWVELCLGVRMDTQVREEMVDLWLKFFFQLSMVLKLALLSGFPVILLYFNFLKSKNNSTQKKQKRMKSKCVGFSVVFQTL